MKSMRATSLGVLSAMLVALVSGCSASKQLLVDTQDALQRCSAELKTCESALSNCEAETTTLRDDVAMQMGLREECLRSAETADAATRDLREREEALREQLATEVAAKDVVIENLKGRLSVRVLDKILFRSGSATILPTGTAVLDKVATVVKNDVGRIRVEGHTDNVPIGVELKRKYFSNWELSGARAATVVRHFENAHGIDPTRLEAVGHSKHQPVAPNDTPENQQKNRRVEIVLTGAE